MFYLEQGSWDAQMGCFRRTLSNGETEVGCSPFQNIIETAYWGFSTVTTVGYGDVLPVTDLGKMFACITMICGIISMALPIGMVSNAFCGAMERMREGQDEVSDSVRRYHNRLAQGDSDTCFKEELEAI